MENRVRLHYGRFVRKTLTQQLVLEH